MIIVVLIFLGLCFGSFVNALVWRIRTAEGVKSKSKLKELSIWQGRSMCPNCKHTLAAKDLVPVLSWLQLRGKCRYCKKAISVQYPVVEMLMAKLFVVSYVFWPNTFGSWDWILLAFWLLALVGVLALAIYDVKWYELPNKLVLYVTIIAVFYLIAQIFVGAEPLLVLQPIISGLLLFSLFWLIFQISDGKWMGGGDVKLVFALGVFAGTPAKALLLVFIASILGSLFALLTLPLKKSSWKKQIPFGPYLIVGTFLVVFFGSQLINWYLNLIGA